MTKHVSNISDTVLSVAKAVPLIAGGIGGLITPARGSAESPIKQLMDGKTQAGMNSLIANYTFFSPEGGQFEASQGRGVKMAVGGAVVHKVMTWLI